jgi:hypothetical protein
MAGPKDFDVMDREDRVRACYQHCALKWVMSERMTIQSVLPGNTLDTCRSGLEPH